MAKRLGKLKQGEKNEIALRFAVALVSDQAFSRADAEKIMDLAWEFADAYDESLVLEKQLKQEG